MIDRLEGSVAPDATGGAGAASGDGVVASATAGNIDDSAATLVPSKNTLRSNLDVIGPVQLFAL